MGLYHLGSRVVVFKVLLDLGFNHDYVNRFSFFMVARGFRVKKPPAMR